MSRSYKKFPYCGDKKGKDKKRFANHAVRRNSDKHPTFAPSFFKRQTNQYDICDYYFSFTWEEYRDMENQGREYFGKPLMNESEEKELYRHWYSYFMAK